MKRFWQGVTACGYSKKIIQIGNLLQACDKAYEKFWASGKKETLRTNFFSIQSICADLQNRRREFRLRRV